MKGTPLKHYLMAPKWKNNTTSGTSKPSSNYGTAIKETSKNNKIPSSSSTSVGASASCSPGSPVHPTRAQHPSFPSPTPGMGQPMDQLLTVWWGPWDPLPPWASFNPNNQGFYNNWQQPEPGSYPWAQQQQQSP